MVVNGIDSSLVILKKKELILNEYKANIARDILIKGQNLIYQYIRFCQLVEYGKDLVTGLTWQNIKHELHTSNEYKLYYKKFTIPKIIAKEPKVIGISIAFEDQIIPAFTLANELKNNIKTKDIHIVAGGPVITLLQGEHN